MYVAIFFDPITGSLEGDIEPVVGESEEDIERHVLTRLEFEKREGAVKGVVFTKWYYGTINNKRVHARIVPAVAVGRLNEAIKKGYLVAESGPFS